MPTAAADELKPLSSYCNKIPGHRAGTKTHISTLIRHATAGVRAPDGRRVKLQATRFGNRWLCCDRWFDTFVSSLTTSPTDPADSVTRTPAQRDRASSAAERELIARGC